MATKTEEKTGADKVTAARNKNLDLAIQQIAKDFGDGAIMRLGDEKIVDIDVIPTTARSASADFPAAEWWRFLDPSHPVRRRSR